MTSPPPMAKVRAADGPAAVRVESSWAHPGCAKLSLAALGPDPHPGRLSALSVFRSEQVLYGAVMWVRTALNGPFRRFLARAVVEANALRDTPWKMPATIGEVRGSI